MTSNLAALRSAMVSDRCIEILLQHYQAEVVQWTNADDPKMLERAQYMLRYWEGVKGRTLRKAA